MSEDPPRRRIVIALSENDQSDPKAILDAVRDAMQPKELAPVPPVKGEVLGPEEESTILPDLAQDKDLQDAFKGLIVSALKEAESKAKKAAAKNQKDAAKDEAERKAYEDGVRARLVFWAAEGVRITVKVCEAIANSVEVIINKGAEFFGGGKKDKE
jgi:hypothetical protein